MWSPPFSLLILGLLVAKLLQQHSPSSSNFLQDCAQGHLNHNPALICPQTEEMQADHEALRMSCSQLSIYPDRLMMRKSSEEEEDDDEQAGRTTSTINTTMTDHNTEHEQSPCLLNPPNHPFLSSSTPARPHSHICST